MTQTATSAQVTGQKQTPQEHHLCAAKHLDEASKHHKEAAKHIDSGDAKTAAVHAQIAAGHTTHAIDQGKEISKQAAKVPDSKN